MPEPDESMWPRFFALLHWVSALLYVAAAATLLFVFKTQLWHSPLLRFMARCWSSFLAYIGSTGPGFISPILVSLLSITGTLACIGFLQGMVAMRKHFWENAAITAVVFVTVMLVVYGTQFVWEVARVAYGDHQYFVSKVKEIRSQGKIGIGSAESEQQKVIDALQGKMAKLSSANQLYKVN